MKSKGSSRLFILAVLVLLMCAATFSIVFSATSIKAASLYSWPTPTPTHGVTPTATAMMGATPTPITGTGASCKVTYTIDAQFHSGFLVEFAIANTGSTTINSWTLQFTFPNGQVITSLFNAGYTQVGSNVTLTSRSYNGTIAPGGVVIAPPGFVATWNNIANNPPALFTLNGIVCSKG